MINTAELNPYAYWNTVEEVHKEILELLAYLAEADKNHHPVIRYLEAGLFSLFFSPADQWFTWIVQKL